MGRRGLTVLSLLFWLLASGAATAATPPDKVVQQFIEAHLQGRFVEARGLTLEQVRLSASLFSNWLFGTGAAGGSDAATADVFLSRKFAQAFRYTITDTTATGDNQVAVAGIRTSPNLAHLYTWALVPKRGAAPYELIEAIDTYLTKVNFPVEESRLQFILVREVDSWYISAVSDEKFAQLQQQFQGAPPLSAAVPLPGAAAPSGPGPAAVATTTSGDLGRQIADAQFNATLQGFNRAYQAPAGSPAQARKADEDEPSFLGKITRSIFGSGSGKTQAKLASPSINRTLDNLRDALGLYAVSRSSYPERTEIYDWQSLRQVVNRYGKQELPRTEAAAGFSFVRYYLDPDRADFKLLLELHEPQDGIKRVEISALSVDRAN